jgi:hypothetical protein
MLDVIRVLLRGIQEALLVSLREALADVVQPADDRSANRLPAEGLREVMAVRNAVYVHDLEERVTLEARRQALVQREDAV